MPALHQASHCITFGHCTHSSKLLYTLGVLNLPAKIFFPRYTQAHCYLKCSTSSQGQEYVVIGMLEKLIWTGERLKQRACLHSGDRSERAVGCFTGNPCLGSLQASFIHPCGKCFLLVSQPGGLPWRLIPLSWSQQGLVSVTPLKKPIPFCLVPRSSVQRPKHSIDRTPRSHALHPPYIDEPSKIQQRK